jgi:hypothetical protein
MRYFLLTLLFLFVTGTGIVFAQLSPEEVAMVPLNVKDQALEKTLEYGEELCLRQDFDQAIGLYKHVLALDPCNTQARDALSMMAKKGYNPKAINDFLASQKCTQIVAPKIVVETPKAVVVKGQPDQPVTMNKGLVVAPAAPIVKMPAPSKRTFVAPTVTAPAKVAPPAPLQGATLQEKIADLQKRVQRIEASAQAQNTRLDKLTNEQPVTQN